MEAEAAEEEEEAGYRIKKRTPHKDVGNDDHFGQKNNHFDQKPEFCIQ